MNTDLDNASSVSITEKADFAEPPEYRVILLNDDYTTKDFVTEVLIRVFHKTETDAVNLMEKVHTKGSAVVGVYVYDIAVTRTTLTIQTARKNGFPLQCIMEKA
ncbi:ATP-dependent Clp protease adaptor ClpS [Treponema sp. OMZ 840]|uniref:ATP-dependent Clp protease adaptor ClpS n=1 Tax=Treponema sp. OMZ 840 TaxID=244313 RepID=UPI003D908D23